MELIRGLYNLRPRHQGTVVTIGNFDGVHRGHQVILESLKAAGRALNLPTTVVIFEPQPQEFFVANAAPPRLMHWRDKVEALRKTGVDRVLCLRFDEKLRSFNAAQFVKQLLVDGLGCRHLVIGDDFRFGCDRSGDFAMLQKAGESDGFTVVNTPTIELDGERVSSTRVREAIKASNFELAARLLGAPFSISGRVAHGDKIGRTLGLPTANVALKRLVSPVQGVYAVDVHGLSNASLHGAANVGTRPAVNGKDNRIEVHLLDFNGDIYGRRIRVEFLHRLRDETNFPSLDALKVAIENDIADTRRYFGV